MSTVKTNRNYWEKQFNRTPEAKALVARAEQGEIREGEYTYLYENALKEYIADHEHAKGHPEYRILGKKLRR
jgi:hypothetical protein